MWRCTWEWYGVAWQGVRKSTEVGPSACFSAAHVVMNRITPTWALQSGQQGALGSTAENTARLKSTLCTVQDVPLVVQAQVNSHGELQKQH